MVVVKNAMQNMKRLLIVTSVTVELPVYSVYWPDCNPEGPLFSAEFVCLCVCVSLTGTTTLQLWPILTKLGHKDPTLI